jgi:hypothetical protein
VGDASGFQPTVTGFETRMGNQMRRQVAGCFYCLKVFKLDTVKKYTADGEMICPHCGVDAVLDGVNCRAVLRRQNAKHFGIKRKETPNKIKVKHGGANSPRQPSGSSSESGKTK